MANAPKPPPSSSALGRLLQELSWTGRNIRDYRSGGQGFENVLTVEVLQALEFLPRLAFLGRVISTATGADTARGTLVKEIEEADISLLPGDNFLKPPPRGVAVQPDGLIATTHCFAVVEAKRIRDSQFQTDQLARELVLAHREAKKSGRQPILLLLLGEEPPIKVQGRPRISIRDAVSSALAPVLARVGDPDLNTEAIVASLPEVVAWTTWSRISRTLITAAFGYSNPDASTQRSVKRLAECAVAAIDRHS